MLFPRFFAIRYSKLFSFKICFAKKTFLDIFEKKLFSLLNVYLKSDWDFFSNDCFLFFAFGSIIRKKGIIKQRIVKAVKKFAKGIDKKTRQKNEIVLFQNCSPMFVKVFNYKSRATVQVSIYIIIFYDKIVSKDCSIHRRTFGSLHF